MKGLMWIAAAAGCAGCGGPALAQRPAPPPPPMAVPVSPQVLQADLRAKTGDDTIYFSAEGSALNPQAVATLRAHAAWLRVNPFVMVRLDGHADQRDTTDYAIAIAERRAAEVRDFLVGQGIAPGRITIASWGKERPGTIIAGPTRVRVGPRVVVTVL